MTIDWDMVQFKRKIIDNARYLFKNYIDTSKGLGALYNRPEVSTNKTKCYKNFNLIRLTGPSEREHITAWKIDDALNINKMYVRAKVGITTGNHGSLIISDSTLENLIMFWISPRQSNSDFRIYFRKNSSDSTIYTESVDLSRYQFYDIEGMIDFENDTISVVRDNVEKLVVISDTLPSFDVIHLGFKNYDDDDIPNTFGKDIFITWE